MGFHQTVEETFVQTELFLSNSNFILNLIGIVLLNMINKLFLISLLLLLPPQFLILHQEILCVEIPGHLQLLIDQDIPLFFLIVLPL